MKITFSFVIHGTTRAIPEKGIHWGNKGRLITKQMMHEATQSPTLFYMHYDVARR